MSARRFRSVQDILRQHRRMRFVGREHCLDFFRTNLEYAPEDERKRFIIHITGPSGVGLTRLLRRLQEIARHKGALTAWVDGYMVTHVFEAMRAIERQLAEQDAHLSLFNKIYRIYRRLYRIISLDARAPLGLPSRMYHYLLDHWWVNRTPIEAALLEKLVDQGRPLLAPVTLERYLKGRISTPEERAILLEPTLHLTRAFLVDLMKVAGAPSPVVIFLDDFDYLADFMEPWLQDVLEGRYGPLSLHVLWVIGSKKPLDRVRWGPYESIMARLEIEPFTETETRNYLLRRGISSPRAIEVIHKVAEGRPLWVAALADEVPEDELQLGSMAGVPVERLMKWMPQEEVEDLLIAALPRVLDEAVLEELVGRERAQAILERLLTKSFVHRTPRGLVLNREVRQALLRYWRSYSFPRFIRYQEQLSQYYQEGRKRLIDKTTPRDTLWQDLFLNEIYHRLVMQPDKALAEAIDGFFEAWETDVHWAYRWATTLVDAGWDVESWNLHKWGQNLLRAYRAFETETFQEAIDPLTLVVEAPEPITRHTRAMAYAYRGLVYFLLRDPEHALADLSEAIRLESKQAWLRERRGVVSLLVRQEIQALKDFTALIQMQQNTAWGYFARGCTHFLLKRYSEALADLNRAVDDTDVGPWALAMRGEVYRVQGYDHQALQDFQEALRKLGPSQWVLSRLGNVQFRMGRFREAVRTLDQVLEQDPENTSALANRALAYEMLGEFDRALEDFNRALELKPDFAWARARRGELYMLMDDDERALKDFEEALHLKPGYTWVRATRALLLALRGEVERALEELNDAVQRDPEQDWYRFYRALLYMMLKRSRDADKDLKEAIRLGEVRLKKEQVVPPVGLLNLMLYHVAAGKMKRAEEYLRQALENAASPFFLHLARHQLRLLARLFPERKEVQEFVYKFDQRLQEVLHQRTQAE